MRKLYIPALALAPLALVALVALVALLALLAGCGRDEGSRAGADEAGQSPYLNVRADAGYLGIDACKSCHADKFETFQHTGMGMSFKPASLAASVADWEDPMPVYDPHTDLYYQPFHADEELFVREYRLEGRDTVHARVERIDYIVGSGQHTNSHIMDVNGYLYQMPITWYAQQGRWDLPPGFDEGGNARFGREIPLECMTCHNARPGFVPNSGNKFDHVPHGIDCEQCHGPGSVHVGLMEAGQVVDTSNTPDYSIVNPGRLPMDLQFDTCQRCHMQGMAVVQEGRTFLDFRPSTPLVETMNVFWPRHSDSLKTFIMASHPDRLKMSECYVATHREGSEHTPMTCVTCHDPHVSVRVTGSDTFNRACQSCHTPAHDNLCTEELSVRARVNDDCASCHMPPATSVDIPHVTITDHNIRVVEPLPEDAVDETREFVGLASLVDPDPSAHNMAQGYLTYYEQFDPQPAFLDSAAAYLEEARAESGDGAEAALFDTEVRLAFLRRDYARIVDLSARRSMGSIRRPWTLYRIAEAYLQAGRTAEALDYLDLTLRQAPDNLEFRTKLGNAYMQAGNAAAAEDAFTAVLEANPKQSAAHNNLGFARLVQGGLERAEADFKEALRLNPDAEQALANLASLTYNTGRADEARGYLRRLLKLAPDNPQYRQMWEALAAR